MQRSAMRELAFKLIYEIEIQKQNDEDQLEIFLENNEINDEKVVEYLKDIQNGIKENESEINSLITSNLKENWSLNRISKINISLINKDTKKILKELGENQIYLSTTTACSLDNTPSKSVLAITENQELASNTIRISLSHLTLESDIDKFIEIFLKLLNDK